MDAFELQPRKHIHHVARVFVTVADEDEAFQVVRRKAANGGIHRAFNVGGALIDRSLVGFARNFDFLELIQSVENRRIGRKRYEPSLVGMPRVVRLLNPVD